MSAINAQVAELLKGYWAEIGVNTDIQQVPQDVSITNALFGDPGFFMYGWRNHAGTTIDSQYFWWHSSAAPPDSVSSAPVRPCPRRRRRQEPRGPAWRG